MFFVKKKQKKKNFENKHVFFLFFNSAIFPMFTVGTLVENLFNLGLFCPHVCGLSHFEDLIRF